MLRNKTAVQFHTRLCISCHKVPGIKDWIAANLTKGLNIFGTAKKAGMWEPFYVGTNAEPYFDERLTWEGRCNKLTQVKVSLFKSKLIFVFKFLVNLWQFSSFELINSFSIK